MIDRQTDRPTDRRKGGCNMSLDPCRGRHNHINVYAYYFLSVLMNAVSVSSSSFFIINVFLCSHNVVDNCKVDRLWVDLFLDPHNK